MLVYNDKISTFGKLVNTSNIGIDKFIFVKLNIELTCNLVENT